MSTSLNGVNVDEDYDDHDKTITTSQQKIISDLAACSLTESVIDFSNFFDLDEIAGGASGQVYSAKSKCHKRKIALKVFRGNEVGDREFVKEYKFLNKLRHPNIVKLLGHSVNNVIDGMSGKKSVRKILILELANSTLSDVYDAVRVEDEIRHKWCEDVLEAVNYIHEHVRIIHRDIKFGNILVFHDGKHWIELGLITINFCFIHEKNNLNSII